MKEASKNTLGRYKGWIILIAIVLSGIALYAHINSVYNETIRREIPLSALYLENQNELSSYVSGFYEQIGIADRKSEAMNKILLDSVRGRYDNGGGLDLSGLTIFDQMLPYIQEGRVKFKNRQSLLIDQVNAYKLWYREGFVRSMILSNFIPTRNLEARNGDVVHQGAAALAMMERIILDSTTKQAYETGVLEPLIGAPKK